MRIRRMKVPNYHAWTSTFEMLHTSSHILLTHDVRYCILLTHTYHKIHSLVPRPLPQILALWEGPGYEANTYMREERVNATLGVNPQFLSHEQVCT